MLRSVQISGVVLAALLAGCSSTATPEADSTTTTASTTVTNAVVSTTTVGVKNAPVTVIGTYGVGVRDKTYVDDSRPTAENGSYKGATTRTLHTLTWYPSSAATPGGDVVDGAAPERTVGAFPLIILSHGVTGLAGVYAGTGVALASAGYVVVAPDYPLSNGAAPGGPVVADVKNQPADASFVLKNVIADNATDFANVIATEHVGAIGHSLGGFTTMGLTFSKCCADPDIDTAVVLAGGPFGTEMIDQKMPTPVLFFHGDADGTVPYTTGRAAYDLVKSPKAFITIPGGAHIPPFLGSASDLAEQYHKALVPWFDRWLKSSVNALDGMRSAVKNSLGRMELEEELR
jgi:dienelactone hydrolase